MSQSDPKIPSSNTIPTDPTGGRDPAFRDSMPAPIVRASESPVVATVHPQDKVGRGESPEDKAELQEAAKFRTRVGIALTVVGYLTALGSIVVGLWLIFSGIDAGGDARIVVARIIASAFVDAAAIYLAYTMIRAGERMFIPRWLMRDAKDVEVARVLLGVEAPLSAALKTTKEVAAVVADLAKPVTDVMTKTKP